MAQRRDQIIANIESRADLIDAGILVEDLSFYDDTRPKRGVSLSKQRYHEMRVNVWGNNAGSGSLDSQKKSIYSLLKELATTCPVSARRLAQVDGCSSAKRCNDKLCAHCSNPKSRQGNRHNKPHQNLKLGYCQYRGTAKGEYSSNYQVRNGQRIIEPLDGLPLCFMHAVTINLGLVLVDLKTPTKHYKKRLRRCYKGLSDGAIVRGYFDFKLIYADEASFEIPDNPNEAPYRHTDEHRRVAMLHVHFIVFDPRHSCMGIRKAFTDEFPGKSRVCVRRPFEDIQNQNDQVVRGLAGYAEYASLGKVELSFNKDNIDALHELVLLDETWDGRTKLLSFGKRSSNIDASLDQTILAEHLRKVKLQLARDCPFKSEHMNKAFRSAHCSVYTNHTFYNASADTIDGKKMISSTIVNSKKFNRYSTNYSKFITSDYHQYIKYLSNSSLKKKAVHAENIEFFNVAKSYIPEKAENLAPP